MDALFTEEKTSSKKLIGKRVEIILRSKAVDIFKNGEYIETKELNTPIEKRLAVVQLINNYKAAKVRLSEVFEISRQTIDNWLSSYKKYGILGLENNTKDSYKKNPHRFKGNKARQLEDERFKAKENQKSQEAKREAEEEPELELNRLTPVETSSYIDDYSFEDNRFAGSMLLIGMIEHLYNFHEMSANIYDGEISFLYIFLQMHILQINSIEQLKVTHKQEFGRVSGMPKLPSMPKIWEIVHAGIDNAKSDQLSTYLFNHQALNGIVGLEELALDGHFIPYYGKEKVHSGFYTQRDMMMPGQTQMYLHDSNGRIVYFETQEGKGNIIKTLKKVSDFVSDINDGSKPLIAVDREVWGVENFIYLSSVRLVTWEKFIQKTDLDSIDIKLFDHEFTKNGKTWKIFEDTKDFRNKNKETINLRRIILHNKQTKKRLSIVTTDNNEDKVVVANVMLNRWGSNENTFKYTKVRTNMHYNPTIKILEESENQEVVNINYTDKNKEVQREKKSLNKTLSKIGKIPVSTNKNEKLRKNRHRDDLQMMADEKNQNIEKLKKELEDIPKRIDIESIGKEKFKKIEHEGINIWTLCETLFWNSRKELILRFKQFIPDFRDTIPVLEALIKAPGKIKNTQKCILVRIEVHTTPRYKSAQIQLLRYMNNLNIKINGKLLQYSW